MFFSDHEPQTVGQFVGTALGLSIAFTLSPAFCGIFDLILPDGSSTPIKGEEIRSSLPSWEEIKGRVRRFSFLYTVHPLLNPLPSRERSPTLPSLNGRESKGGWML
jgi:hypothetical protein